MVLCAFRQGYLEGYYDSKSGWSSQSDHYADYYSGQYEYGGACGLLCGPRGHGPVLGCALRSLLRRLFVCSRVFLIQVPKVVESKLCLEILTSLSFIRK